MTKCTAPRNGHKRGSAALLSCPVCGPRGGVVVRAGAVVPATGGGYLGPNAKLSLAENSKDPDVLAALAGDKDSDVRWRVARNPNTPAAALEVLAGDESPYVRQLVSENPSAPVAVLELLAGDKSLYVRVQVAKNLNASAAVLEELAGDRDDAVRWRVAENLSTSISVVAELVGDTSPRVASAARSRFSSWAQETLDLGSAPTGQLIDMLVALKAWELDPQDPAVTAAVVLCN